ncbi:MAG TPA: hypothetical protein DHV28_10700 [Ignavibacteriales bacterium]|nr:hypothetical protein [Ignavibacteriales bacterium]
MENQPTLFKGELMEELLRNYFLNLGYYVARSVKFQYDGFDITDVDLYLYGRSSSLTRQRINVDIKNKKSPQAFERILWANGLMKLLNFDSSIVATTDQRPVIQRFGQLHNTVILDGSFLSKLRANTLPDRLSEEEFLSKLSNHKSYKTFSNKDWRYIYESSKSKLLTEQDFSGFNSVLSILIYFIEKAIIDEQKREDATRMTYIILSHLLIIIDYIVKDIAFLETSKREKKLSDGFRFGNLGEVGVDKVISMAVQISGNRSAGSFLKSLENIPTDILKDFFSKNENSKNLFNWAKDFENLGFKKTFINPELIESPLKGVISVILDFANIERRKFFESYSKLLVTNEKPLVDDKN